MKKSFYLSTFIAFTLLFFYTLIHINTKLIANEDAVLKHFFDLNPEEFVDQNAEEPNYEYEKSTDTRQVSATQSVNTMLKALNVSGADIEAIGQLMNIDKTIVQKKSFIKMLYQDDVNEDTLEASIMPPYISEENLVRNIKYLSFPVNNTRYILTKVQEKFLLKKNKVTTERKAIYAQGKIEGSLYDAFITQDIPHEVFQTFVNIYSFDVDFQRDIRQNDTFEIVYDKIVNDEGFAEGLGRVLYVKLDMKTKKDPLEYFILRRAGRKEYYDRQGKAVSKTFMKTPVNGARVSSRYGYRKHPILGYSKLHTGTDFAAPRGTAIYAAADGVITFMGWNGGQRTGYGRYTIIRHNRTYSTAYAHQLRFNNKLRQGSHVKQGQIIGYVGSTGYSTGPHLHYEVIKNGKKINPATVTSLTKAVLTGADRKTLFGNIRFIDDLIREERDK